MLQRPSIGIIKDFMKYIMDNLIKYRYLIALITFIVLVLFKVNGSSADLWRSEIPTDSKSSVISGRSEYVRTDEWQVQTPYILAQANGDRYYPVVNDTVTPSGQNMIVSYNVPVMDISVLAKPFNWGFLLFGTDYGMAWYWNMKIILLLLLSFELCMIITQQNKLISLVGSFWIAFSPAIQWWFMQHVCDSVLYMEAIVVLFYYYLRYHDILYRKIIFAALFALSCVGYVLILYPAVQVPLMYLTLLFIILILVGYSKTVKFNYIDIIIGAGTVLCIGLMMVHVLLISKDAISAIMNTVYPGKRSTSGMLATKYWFYSYLTNPFLPYKNIPFSNSCELSSFINFLPAVLLIIPFLIKKKAQNTRYCIGLTAYILFLLVFMFCKVPKIIAKITLMSYVTHRIVIAYGIASVFLSIWALSEMSRLKGPSRIYCIAGSALICFTYYLSVNYTQMHSYLHLKYYFVLFALLTVLNYCLMRGKKKTFSVLMCGLVAVSGLPVNPINIGISSVNHNTAAENIQSIVKKDKSAYWIADGECAYGIFLYANGAKTVGGVNFYPDMAKWKKLDPTGKDNFIYNRYAHIAYNLTQGKTEMKLLTADSMNVNLNVEDLKKLNISYVFSNKDLSRMNSKNLEFENMYPENNNSVKIYKVVY